MTTGDADEAELATEPDDAGGPRRAVVDKLAGLPAAPGCYLFFDAKGAALYVGKAKSLRSRVRSYFQEGGTDERYFIPLLRRVVFDLETIVTASEKEAAVLENQLIKKHQPRFNVKLRDDKDFLCLRLDESKAWPRLETVRRPSPDGARYFGPYHSATSARRTLHVVNKHFRLRTCSDADFESRKRPCLQYQIKRCPAPCVLEVDRDEYGVQVRAVGLFLEGRHDELTRVLDDKMREASRSMEFERAAIYRDQLHAVHTIRENQRVVSVSDVDQDVIGLYREGSVVEIEILFVRSGRVSDAASYSLRKVELPDAEVLAGFLGEHYGSEERGPMPDEVLVPVLPDGAQGFADMLAERRGRKVTIFVPQRGPKKKLLDMAHENAKHAFDEKRRSADDLEARLEEVRDKLRLPVLPRRIECCDISHLGGEDTVGSIVSLENGKPDRKRYRSFTVKSATGGDDYAAMYEVLARRFRRARESENGEWELPDLFVVDGGRGQLNVALSAAHDLGVHDLPIVGLAKERESVTGEKFVDRVYLPGQKNGIPLRSSSSALFFLARARDEAHRFANHLRKRQGKKARFKSRLDDIAGVGPKTKAALFKRLGTIDGIRAASDEALLAVPGVTKKSLAALRAALGASTPPDAPPPPEVASDAAESAPVESSELRAD
jgi:excinuclease ABC subunit C